MDFEHEFHDSSPDNEQPTSNVHMEYMEIDFNSAAGSESDDTSRISIRQYTVSLIRQLCGDKVVLLRIRAVMKDYVKSGHSWNAKSVFFDFPCVYCFSFAGLAVKEFLCFPLLFR